MELHLHDFEYLSVILPTMHPLTLSALTFFSYSKSNIKVSTKKSSPSDHALKTEKCLQI